MIRELCTVPVKADTHLLMGDTVITWCGTDRRRQALILTTTRAADCTCTKCHDNILTGNRPKVVSQVSISREDRRQLAKSYAEQIQAIDDLLVRLDARERLTEEQINLAICSLRSKRTRLKIKETVKK